MKTATINIYTFDELSDEAKDVARAWWREGSDYPFFDDWLNSVQTFCKEFGVSVTGYEIDLCRYSYLKTDAENQNFRGLKLCKYDREAMPTGYCTDSTLWCTFCDEWKRTGSPKLAFEAAINEAVDEVVKDMEFQLSDEVVDDMLTINEYDFTEDGKIY